MKLLVLFLLVFLSCLLEGVTAPPCKDKNRMCKSWADRGQCKINPNYMNTWCKKSCKKCPGKKKPGRKKKYGRKKHGGKRYGGNDAGSGSACVDRNKYCASWASQGQCQKNKVYMDEYCQRSCGICQTECKDVNNNCAYWKTQGYCVTTADYMKINCPRTCGKCGGSQWSDWRKWSSCSKTCGKGTQTRTRACSSGTCTGSSKQTRDCNIKPCVSQWRSWGRWSSCSKTCGKGTQTRKRTCPDRKCQGSATQKRYCNTKSCPVVKKYTCGKQGHVEIPGIGRVVGGTNAVKGEWPWQVGLVRSDANGRKPAPSQLPFCGGTLISPNIVLTAAHCFAIAKYPEDFFVRVGDHSMKTEGTYEKMLAVKQLITHDKFSRKTYMDDIALVILKETLSLNNEINIACLPDTSKVISPCIVTGWGRTEDQGLQADVLQKAPLPIVANSICNTAYKNIFTNREKIIGDNMICAGYKDGNIDACQGDSGGPLVCKNSDGRFVLQGIVSWGVGCAKAERYGVYTNTYKYMGWINSKVNL